MSTMSTMSTARRLRFPSLRFRGVPALLVLLGAGFLAAEGLANPVPAVDAETRSGLPDYRREVSILADVPGASSSVAAGWFNPAQWTVHPDPGLFLAWSDSVASRNVNRDRADQLMAVLSLRRLGFGYRRFNFRREGDGRESHLDEYTLGFAGGDRSHAFGLSYSWNRGDDVTMPRHQRLTLGEVHRWRFLSVGLAGAFDLERKDNYGQIDLGVRPLGPRLTVFADAVTRYGESIDDVTLGGGLEVRPLPGLTLAARASDLGPVTEFSARIGFHLGTGSSRPAVQMQFSEDGDHVGTTYALELGGRHRGLAGTLIGRGSRVPELSLKGPMTYRRYRFFDDRRTLLETLDQINALAEDPTVGGVVLNLSGIRVGAAMLWELREQLAGLRAAGKTVTVYVDRLHMGTYMLASVADQIWMDPEGEIEMPGVAAGRTYMRGVFDKLGIGVAELRMHTYKSAMETFSRRSMSEADREQFTDLVDAIYETVAEAATNARGISRDQWDRLVNEKGILTADEALEAGLVDSLGGYEKARQAADRVEPRATVDRSHQVLPGVTGEPVWSHDVWGEPGRIALLYAIGPCEMDAGIKGRLLSKKIRQARKDPEVKAIVLRADSPGGDPLPSDLVSRELLEASRSKPVIVSQGDVAGSGGYWISMFGDSILTTPFTITGSIGVASGYIWNDGFGEKTGLTYDFVKRGEHADQDRGMRIPLINQTLPERPMTVEERERAEERIRSLYQDFVGKVAEGRGLSEERVDEVGQGRIWMGADAREVELVDGLGNLWGGLRMAKSAAGLDPGEEIVITEGPSLGAFDLSFLRPSLVGLRRMLGLGGGPAEQTAATVRTESPWSVSPGHEAFLEQLLGAERWGQLAPAQRFFVEQILRSQGRPLIVTEPIEIDWGGEEH